MKYQIIGKNIEVTKGIEEALIKKLSKMDKYFVINDDVDCRAVVRTYKTGQKVEVTITTPMMTFRAEVTDADLYAAFDLAIDKLEGQILLENVVADEEDEAQDEVVKTKSYYLDPMSIDEAIARMEALGHDFFMYLDEEDELVSVVYHRRDGGYGIIQAENKLK